MTEGWEAARSRVASEPYGPSEPLLRVLVDADGSRLFVGAHHGAVDGLGLVAVAGAAAGLTVPRPRPRHRRPRGPARLPRAPACGGSVRPWSARHRGSRPASHRCRRWSRTSGSTRSRRPGAARPISPTRWSRRTRPERRRAEALLLLGASRRTEDEPAPDRQTAYLRLRAARSATVADLRSLIAAAEPEPDFPETSARGIGPRVTHLLRGRLGRHRAAQQPRGAGGPGLGSVAMFPATSGPRAVAVGLATAGGTTT